jgi:hypothetical protein
MKTIAEVLVSNYQENSIVGSLERSPCAKCGKEKLAIYELCIDCEYELELKDIDDRDNL